MKISRTAPGFVLGIGMGVLLARAVPADARGAHSEVGPVAGTIVVQNAYWPKADMAEDVVETRLAASAVRRDNGLVVGRVLRVVDGPEGAPLLIWEAEYESADARAADVAALEETNFRDVSSHMGTLLDGFSRTVFEVIDE